MISYVKWFGTFLVILGALFTSFKVDPLNIYFLNAGSLVWVIAGFKMKEYSIVSANVVMLIIYIIGIFFRM